MPDQLRRSAWQQYPLAPSLRASTQCASCASEYLRDVFAHCCCRRCFEIRRRARGCELCRLAYKFNQAWTDVQMKLPSPRRVPCVRGRLELRFPLYAFLLTIFRARLCRFVAVLPRRASRVSYGTRLRVTVSCNFVQSVESALWRRNLSFRGLTFFSLRV